MNIAIIGLGLIGGSLAKAFSEYTEHRVIGFDRDPSVVQRALSVQAINEMGEAPSLSQADVIYLCVSRGRYPVCETIRQLYPSRLPGDGYLRHQNHGLQGADPSFPPIWIYLCGQPPHGWKGTKRLGSFGSLPF